MPLDATLLTQLSTELFTRYSLSPSQAWLNTFLASTRQPPPPFQALLSTAHFRLLNSDFTTSLIVFPIPQTSNLLPANLGDVNVKETRLRSNVPVQVLDIIDVGMSQWSQVEAIERVERGEEVRGREVIRNVPGVTDDDDEGGNGTGAGNARRTADGQINAANGQASTKRSQGPHKLILQDADKQNMVAFELEPIPKVWVGEDGISIGCKMILKSGTLVRRGMIMLQPDSVTVLGGKIDSWDKRWREDRKKRLTADVERETQERQNGA
jgi:RecQ-mediated genome instability protein 1